MDYDSTLKLMFLLGFAGCLLLVLTVHSLATLVRLFLLRLEVKELARQVEQLEQSPRPPEGSLP